MKKMRIMVLLVLTLFVGFIVSTNVFAETTTAATTTAATTTAATTVDVYDTGNLSLALGMITYEDVTLTDGWYHFAIALDGLDNPAGLLQISYYTGTLATGYDFYDSTYTDNVKLLFEQFHSFLLNILFRVAINDTSSKGAYDEDINKNSFSLKVITAEEILASKGIDYNLIKSQWDSMNEAEKYVFAENQADPKLYATIMMSLFE